VNVVDRRGNIVRDLRKENFRILIDSRPAQVQDVSYEEAPRRILILLDISGSMGITKEETGKWRVACEAIAAMLAQVPADSPMALLAFDKKVEHAIGFAEGRPAIASLLGGGMIVTRSPRATAVFDMILEGLKFLQPFQAGDSIYLISDGNDTASHVSSKQTKAAVLESGVRLFSLLLPGPAIFDPDQLTVDDFTQLVRESGGSVFSIAAKTKDSPSPFNMGQGREPTDRPSEILSPQHAPTSIVNYDAPTREKLEMYSQDLNRQIMGFYVLRILMPPSRKQRKIALQITNSTGELRKDVQIAYPRAVPSER
jgi:hypothetical protein